MSTAPRARLVWRLVLVCAIGLAASIPAAAETPERPRFTHGAGQVLAGLIVELPKTVLDATLSGPPVVGTAVGLLAGTRQALERIVDGLGEMVASFKPVTTKKIRRRR